MLLLEQFFSYLRRNNEERSSKRLKTEDEIIAEEFLRERTSEVSTAMYNEILSTSAIILKEYQQKNEQDEKIFNPIFTRETLFNLWIRSVDGIIFRQICDSCGNRMILGSEERGNEFWICTSGNSECETFRMDEKFCFHINVSLKKLLQAVYMWLKKLKPEYIMDQTGLFSQEFDYLDKVLTEICVTTCTRKSVRIGGFRVPVNVEIGRRGGLKDAKKIAICGVCADDHTQYFFTILTDEYPFYLEMKDCLRNWLRPGTIVRTSNNDYVSEMKWISKEKFTLISHTENLARDLWIHVNRHLQCIFESFILVLLRRHLNIWINNLKIEYILYITDQRFYYLINKTLTLQIFSKLL